MNNHNGAAVKVTMTDGKTFSAKFDRALGRTTENPIPLAQLQGKFADCAQRVLTPAAAATAARTIDAFECVKSMREFTALLEPAAPQIEAERRRGSP